VVVIRDPRSARLCQSWLLASLTHLFVVMALGLGSDGSGHRDCSEVNARGKARFHSLLFCIQTWCCARRQNRGELSSSPLITNGRRKIRNGLISSFVIPQKAPFFQITKSSLLVAPFVFVFRWCGYILKSLSNSSSKYLDKESATLPRRTVDFVSTSPAFGTR
jgi:hypothetical protein